MKLLKSKLVRVVKNRAGLKGLESTNIVQSRVKKSFREENGCIECNPSAESGYHVL